MKTLTQTALEFRAANPSQPGIYVNNEVIGLIQAHPGLGLRWEYRSYAAWDKPFVGTYEECVAIAQKELDPSQQPTEAVVTAIATESTPAYLATHSSWRAVGAGYVTEVTVRTTDIDEVYTVQAPSTFARKLSVGSTVELFPTKFGVAIRWCKKPIRRQAAIAA